MEMTDIICVPNPAFCSKLNPGKPCVHAVLH